MKIEEYLKENRIITDGAFGTYFQKKFQWDEMLVERANTEAPQLVKQIHLEYIAAGAKLIRTNTFATNTMFFEDMDEVCNNCRAGFRIASEAVAESGREVFVAADLGPIYDSDSEEFETVLLEYQKICDTFFESGARIFLFETLSDLNYIIPLLDYIKQKGDTFVIAQFSFDKSGYTKSGLSVKRMVEKASEMKALDAYGFNCGVEAAHLYQLLKEVTFPSDKYITALPNAGYPVVLRGKTIYSNHESYFVEMQEKIARLGIDILGGCCGTEPSYIAHLKKNLDELPKMKKRIGVLGEERTGKASHALEEKFAKNEKVYIVELDPPFQTDITKVLGGAKILKDNRVDLVTLADSPMARARMDAGILAAKVQSEVGIPVMPHICCRDKNVLALRASMLGDYMSGIRQFLFITGDPVAREFKGKVSSVFDFNSIKLMNYVNEMNADVFKEDPVCYSGALNYHGANVDAIIKRMQMKVDEGCTFFLTQPVYTDEDVERIRYIKAHVDTRIICGIMPLVNYKNALFVCSEMPGIHITKETVERYDKDMTREEAEEVATEISVEIAEKLYDVADGFYMMTPFNRAALISNIVSEIRKIGDRSNDKGSI